MPSEGAHQTESLCPQCLARIPATLSTQGEEVFMEKQCPDHGTFRVLVWKGQPALDQWRRPKPVAKVATCLTESSRGCPYDCGICPSHRQIGCTGLLEITQRCNLSCPVCFADSGAGKAEDPSLEQIEGWYHRVMAVDGPCSIQLSGGEPTLRTDLPEIIGLGRELGFSFIQLNTNGIRLAADKGYARTLREAGLVSVFLQFDGLDDAIYLKLRGRALLQEKLRAIEHCVAGGLGVVLVPTLVPGVNTDQLGAIIQRALELGPGIRGVHFQPAAHMGRFPAQAQGTPPITLPEVMTAIAVQTHGLVSVEQFRPPGCEHERCSFHGSFLRLPGGGLGSVAPSRDQTCCSGSVTRTVALVARQWAAPSRLQSPGEALFGAPQALSLDEFLSQATDQSFTISGMAFQDAWTLDLERLKSCCIHVATPDGRLVPFCAYNLTSEGGVPLHRSC